MERKNYLDVLRIVAICAVIMLHASAPFVINYDSSLEFTLGNIFECISRLGVPIFLMISGAIMLDENREFNYKKRIFSLLIPLIIWSFLYAFIFFIVTPLLQNQPINFFSFITAFFKGHYHLWYMWAIIGLYLITPILRKFVKKENKRVVYYFIILSLLFCFTKPLITILFEEISFLSKAESIYLYVLGNLNLDFLGGLTTYYLTGWLLSNTNFSLKNNIFCYFTGFVSLILLILIAQIFPVQCSVVYSNYNLLLFFYAIAVFLIVKNICLENIKTNKFIVSLSKLSFGVYLIHDFILNITTHILPQNPFFIPLIFLVTIIVSFAITFVISKIPVIKKIIKT